MKNTENEKELVLHELKLIAGTLKKGPLNGGQSVKFFYVLAGLLGVLALSFLVLGIVLLIQDGESDIYIGLAVVLPILAAAIVGCFLGGYLAKKTNNKILTLLDDSIFTKAYSEKIDIINTSALNQQAKIKIIFEIDGEVIERVSEFRQKRQFGEAIPCPAEAAIAREGGFDDLWTRFADKEVEILYSKTHDDVLLLKCRRMYSHLWERAEKRLVKNLEKKNYIKNYK